MSLSVYERENTIKTEIDYKSDGVFEDPSGNTATVTIIKPDGTYLLSGQSASRESTGNYYYYFDTEATDPLGIYVVLWKAYHSLGDIYGYKPIVQRESFILRQVD